jgi:hypothetical protein
MRILKEFLMQLNSTQPSKRRRIKRGRRYWKKPYKRNMYTPYSMSTKPTRYGPGTNVCVINRIVDIAGSSTTRYPLQTLLLENAEFTTKKQYFRYFKLLEVRVCFYPSGITDAGLIYVNLTWNSITYSLEDLQKDDTTKITSSYRTKNKVFRWLPIRGVINVNSISQEVPTNFVDISDFISTDRVVSLPGWLYISNLPNNGTAANIEIKVLFRGNDFGTVAKKKEISKDEIFKIKEEKIEKPTQNLNISREDINIIEDEKEIGMNKNKEEEINKITKMLNEMLETKDDKEKQKIKEIFNNKLNINEKFFPNNDA